MRKKNLSNSPKEGPGKNVTHLSIPQTFLWLFIYFLQKPEVKRDKTTGKGPGTGKGTGKGNIRE